MNVLWFHYAHWFDDDDDFKFKGCILIFLFLQIMKIRRGGKHNLNFQMPLPETYLNLFSILNKYVGTEKPRKILSRRLKT